MTIAGWTGVRGLSNRPRIGIDSYSFHRLLGEIRPGERPVQLRWQTQDVLAEAQRLGVETVSLETCFIDRDRDLEVLRRHVADGSEVILAWGHRDGLSYGRNGQALDDARQWIDIADEIGCSTVRVVAASPWVVRSEGDSDDVVDGTVAAINHLLAHCGDRTQLVLENHADLSMDEFVSVLGSSTGLGVCFDTANALRVAADPVESARRLCERITMIHLKDVRRSEAVPSVGPESCRYGHGIVDLEGVLTAVGGHEFDGAICIELGHLGGGVIDERSLVADGVRWLRERLG